MRKLAVENGESQSARQLTVVGWALLVLATKASFILLLWNLVFRPYPPFPADRANASDMPMLPQLFYAHAQLLLLFALLIAVAAMIAAVGTLQRRAWARQLLITLCAVAVPIGLLFAIFVQQMMAFVALHSVPGTSRTGLVLYFLTFFGMLFGLGLSVLGIWFIKQLRAPGIRVEFASSGEPRVR